MFRFKRYGWYIFILSDGKFALVTVQINAIEGSLIKTVEVDTSKEHDYDIYSIQQDNNYMISNCACVADVNLIRR